jgi:cytochrome b561
MSARSASRTTGRGADLRQTATTVALHWSTVAAVVITVIAIYLRDFSEDKPLRQFLLVTHRQLGLLILIGVPLRILARYWLGFARASVASAIARWTAAACHIGLYALLSVVAVIGWTATSAKNTPLYFLWAVPLPSLTQPDPDVADMLLDYHKWGAWTLLALAGVHALAAFWHHFYLRDGVLKAMLPGLRGRGTVYGEPAHGGADREPIGPADAASAIDASQPP